MPTLLEKDEMERLGGQNLRAAVEDWHMDLWHLPIQDAHTLGEEMAGPWWATSYYHLLPLLRAGSDVLVHCKGGWGARWGMPSAPRSSLPRATAGRG